MQDAFDSQDALDNQADLTTLDFEEVRGSTQSPDYYPAEDLFPQLGGKGEIEAQQYVEGRLIELAKADALSVTELHNQSPRAMRLAGMSILGHYIDPEGNTFRVEPNRVPFELQQYRVKVRSIGNRPIGYKAGMVPRRSVRNRAGRVHLYEEVRRQTTAKEAVVTLQQAWTILHQNGKYCVRAKTATAKALFWHYEEVPRDQWSPPSMPKPEAEQEAAPAQTGRRGR